MHTKDITPVRIGERWIDDGSLVEVWSEDGSTGLMLEVAARIAVPQALALQVSVLRGETPGEARARGLRSDGAGAPGHRRRDG